MRVWKLMVYADDKTEVLGETPFVVPLRSANNADRSGLAVYGAGLRPFACWNCGLQARRVHG